MFRNKAEVSYGVQSTGNCSALTNVTLPYAVEIADFGWRGALQRDAALRPGLNVHEGRVTCAAVAEAFDMAPVALEDVLA